MEHSHNGEHCEMCTIRDKYKLTKEEASFVIALLNQEHQKRVLLMKMLMMELNGRKLIDIARERSDELFTPEIIREAVERIDAATAAAQAQQAQQTDESEEMQAKASAGFSALMEKIQEAGGVQSPEQLMEMAKDAGFTVMSFGHNESMGLQDTGESKPTVH